MFLFIVCNPCLQEEECRRGLHSSAISSGEAKNIYIKSPLFLRATKRLGRPWPPARAAPAGSAASETKSVPGCVTPGPLAAGQHPSRTTGTVVTRTMTEADPAAALAAGARLQP